MAQRGNVLKLIQVNQALAAGMASGLIEGYRALVNAVSSGDLGESGFDNPLLRGALLGWIEYLDKVGESLTTALTGALRVDGRFSSEGGSRRRGRPRSRGGTRLESRKRR